jgi:hypothetical protein
MKLVFKAFWAGMVCGVLMVFMAGCTHFYRNKSKLDAPMQELSRAFTTAVVDTLSVAPTNSETVLALDLARHDQELEGFPLHKLDATKLLTNDTVEVALLKAKYAEAAKLRVLNEKYESQLQALGQQIEVERNKSIWRRMWVSITGTIGITGVIVLCVLCPGLIPIFGRILAWIVGKVPSTAGALGVVGKDAFDAVVTGIQEYRNNATSDSLDNHLHRETDEAHRDLIDARKKALGLEEVAA